MDKGPGDAQHQQANNKERTKTKRERITKQSSDSQKVSNNNPLTKKDREKERNKRLMLLRSNVERVGLTIRRGEVSGPRKQSTSGKKKIWRGKGAQTVDFLKNS